MSRFFSTTTIERHHFGIRMSVTSTLSMDSWMLVVVYGPCRQPERDCFVSWLDSFNFDDDDLWLLIRDFNFYRSMDNRNKSGGSFIDTLIFNNIISNLGLIELPLKGRSFTWSNMQDSPLPE